MAKRSTAKQTRYSRWDGTQKWHDLNEEEIANRLFEELSNYMNWSLSAQEALEWLMRQGMKLPNSNMRVIGSDELLQELRRQRQESFQAFNFDHALDDVRAKLDEIVEREVRTSRSELGAVHPEFLRREEALRSLPLKESEAIEKLEGYDKSPGFLDREAQRLFDELKERQQSVKELERFIRRYGHQFQGADSLDFDEAVKMMNRFKQMAALAEALRSGNFQEISLEELREFLQEDQIQSILILSSLPAQLEKAGFIRQSEQGIRLTPRGFRKIGQNALTEIFKNLQRDQFGLHSLARSGVSTINPEETRPYEFGRPFNVDIVRTLSNALRRGQIGPRIQVSPDDFEVYQESHETQCTTVLMLDMSWSMSRDGRFPAAKRVALAMDYLIRLTYPRDHYHTIGFSTRARELNTEQLYEATWDPSDPFTNLQEGLYLARQLFRKHRSRNKQIIVITDGQPTATHINGHTNAQWPGFMGSIPPDIQRETLKEVDNCTREHIVINTFMLDDNPVLTKFVEEMTRINHGRAFFSLPHNLGKYLLVDYLAQRRKRIA
ncbi:MAG: VWA domain-containing protein [Candidatus Lambdaproteobacteria bacterium]|nr:VWA domain-containing protein [Candidatus Lambdaproteobacteria bacterium]